MAINSHKASQARLRIALLGTIGLSSALLLTACVSPAEMQQQEQLAAKVITALPTEVQGCTFLGNVDAQPRMSIGNSRFELKVLLWRGTIGQSLPLPRGFRP